MLRVRRLLIVISLLIVIPLGILSKQYRGIGQLWIHDYLGDILSEIFWCLVVFWFIVRAKATHPQKIKMQELKIALGVFIVTCIIKIC